MLVVMCTKCGRSKRMTVANVSREHEWAEFGLYTEPNCNARLLLAKGACDVKTALPKPKCVISTHHNGPPPYKI